MILRLCHQPSGGGILVNEMANVRGKSRNLLLLTLRAKVICIEREKLRIGLDSSAKSSVCNT